MYEEFEKPKILRTDADRLKLAKMKLKMLEARLPEIRPEEPSAGGSQAPYPEQRKG